MSPTPGGGWIGSTLDRSASRPFDYMDEMEDRRTSRLKARIENRRALIALLGAPVFLDTYALPLIGGATLEPFVYRHAPALWSLWAPHRRLLIDIFTAELPSSEELDAKDGFAREHGLDYFYIAPGHVLDFDELRALLTARERAA